VSNVVSDCAHRAGLGPIRAHRLRHTAATAMLRAGSPLAEVGQVLLHRSALTTSLYVVITAPFSPSIAQRVRPEAPLNPQSQLRISGLRSASFDDSCQNRSWTSCRDDCR
jgi:integrase